MKQIWQARWGNGLNLLLLSLIVLIGGYRTGWSDQTRPITQDQVMDHWRDSYRRYMEQKGAAVREGFRLTARDDTTNWGSIQGRLSGIDPQDTVQVYVEAWSADTVTSDWHKGMVVVEPDYSYRIDGLGSGQYYVMAWAEGYEPQYYDNRTRMAEAEPVKVWPGQITRDINFNLTKIQPGTGSIYGQVRDQSSGTPIAGAWIQVYSSDGYYDYRIVLSDSSGCYTVKELRSGKYWVEACADEYRNEWYDNRYGMDQADQVVVTEPAAIGPIDFDLSKLGSIRGNVTDERGNPLTPSVLLAYQIKPDSGWLPDYPGDTLIGWYEGKAVTDSLGNYRITGLMDGDYRVSAVYYDSWRSAIQWYDRVQTEAEATPITIAGATEVSGIDFQMPISVPTGVIAGQVRDASLHPVAYASLYLQVWDTQGSDSAGINLYASSDSNGYFQFTNLPQGGYRLMCSAKIGYWNYVSIWWPEARSYLDAQPIELSDGQIVRDCDFRLPLSPGNSSISGRITSNDGQPLTFVSIQVYPQSTDDELGQWSAYGYSDSTGIYQIDYLPAGSYRLKATYYGGTMTGTQWYNLANDSLTSTVITLDENQSVDGIDFSIRLKAVYGVLRGKILNAADSTPIAGAYVELNNDQGPDGFRYCSPSQSFCAPGTAYTLTDQAGEFSIDWIQEGRYTLVAYANGGMAYYPSGPTSDRAEWVEIIGGETTSVDWNILLYQDGHSGITGLITSDDGWTNDTISGTAQYPAVAMAIPAGQVADIQTIYSALTDKNGTYCLTNIPAGDYYVIGMAPWRIMEYYDNAIDPGMAQIVRVDENQIRDGINFGLSSVYYLDWKNIENPLDGYTPGIFGQVTNLQNRPMGEVSVYLLDSVYNPLSFTRTSVEGEYAFYNIQPGEYYLQASKLGFTSVYNGNTAMPMSRLVVGEQPVEVNLCFSTPAALPETGQNETIRKLCLLGNSPNPFNPDTRIRFVLPEASPVLIRIFSTDGKLIRIMDYPAMESGNRQVIWDGLDRHGRPVGSGIYLYRLETRGESRSGKMTLLR